MKTLNNSLARQLTKNKTPDIELAEVIAVGKGTVDIKTSTGSIYRHVPIAGSASMGDDIRLQFVRNKPLAFGGNGSSSQSTSSGGGANIVYSGGALSAHALNGPYHTGQLDASQATWAFAVDGSRTMTGSINLGPGLLVDGIDVSVFGARSVLSSGLGLSGGGVLYAGDVTISLTSSSYPGVAASILATDGGGFLGVQRFGIGNAANASYALYSSMASPSYFASDLRVGTNLAGTSASRLHVLSTTNQAEFGYDANNYLWMSISSAGVATINTTGSTPANAHLLLSPGGNVSIGGTSPAAKLEVYTTTLDQLRLYQTPTVYATHNVSSAGVYTISNTHPTPANAHILINPSGNLGINMTGAPGAELEVRSAVLAQQRWSYDATAYTSITVNSGGNATLTTYGSDLIFDLQPVGGLAGAKYLMPANNYDVNIGRLTKKYLSLHAAELVVENLIAFDTQSTTGGRLLITPAEVLTEDFPATASTNFIIRSGFTSANQTSSSSWVITPPAGAVTGDLLIVWVTLQTAATVTATGWTQIGSTQSWTAGRQTQAYWKFKQAGETTYTFSLSSSKAGLWQMGSYTNVDTTTPIDASGFQINAAASTHPAPSVTTTRDWDILLYFASYTSTTAQFTPPPGMAELIDAPNSSTTCTNFMAEELRYAAGATGTRTATAGLPTYTSCTASIALKAKVIVPLTGKYNNLMIGDVLHFEAGGHVEFAQVYAGPLAGANNKGPFKYLITRNLDGTGANDWVAGDVAVNMGQAGAGFIDLYSWWSAKGAPFEFIYNYDGTSYSDNLTLANNWNLFRPLNGTVAAGDIIYFGMGGGFWENINILLTTTNYTTFTGVLEYWNGSAWTNVVSAVTTNYPSTTGVATTLTTGVIPNSIPGVLTHTWSYIAQTGWAKTTINGNNAYWVRWRATTASGVNAVVGRRVMRAAVQYGPTIVGNVRNSTVYNDWSERWAIGNLHGLYDYGKVTYGFAAGVYTASWIAVDAENGLRIMNGIANLGQWDIAGNIKIGKTANGQSRVEISNTGIYSIINRQSAVDTIVGQWDASGNLTIGAAANTKSRVYISAAGRVSIYTRDSGGVDAEKFYVDNSGNMGLIGSGTNYFTVNGSTGVATFSGSVNIINGVLGEATNNLAYNSNFDVDINADGVPDGWTVYNNNSGSSVTPSIQSSGGVDNGKYYRITLNVGNNGTKGITANNGTIVNGFKQDTYYIISWYGRSSVNRPTGFGMFLAWNNNPSSVTTILNPDMTTTWQRYAYKVRWNSPTAVDPNIFITANTLASYTGYHDIDQIQVEAGEILTPYRPRGTEILPGSVAYGTDISGVPISNAGKLVLAPAPSGSGLFLTSTLMGYYSGSQWQTYIDNSGNFMLRGAPTANIGVVTFNPSTARLSGGYYAGASYTSYVEQWYTDGSNGAIWAGGGTITLGKDGLIVNYGQNITFGSSTSPNAYASKIYAESYYASNVTGGNFGETALTRLMLRNGVYGVNLVPTQMQNVAILFQQSTANNTVLTGTSTPFAVSASTAYEFGSWFYFNTASVTGTPDTKVQYSIDWYTAGSAYISTNSFSFYPPTSADYGPKFYRFSATSPGTAALAHLRILKTGIGSGGTSLHGADVIKTTVYTASTYSSFGLTNAGVLANGSLLISNAWSSYPDLGNNGWAEISNDIGTYRELMIVGNKSAGGTRHVGVWDQLYVHGNLIVDNGMRSPVYSSGLLNFTNYGVASFPISAGASAFSATVGESATIKFWHQAWYVAGTNDGSNFWTIGMTNNAGTTMIANWNTASLGSNTWVLKSITGLSVAIGASDKMLAINVSKTGNPGNLYLAGPMVYVQ